MNGKFIGKKLCHVLGMVLLVYIIITLFTMLGTVAYASGLVDDTIDAGNQYSKYPINNYQLDFYVDNSWSWLPWNWLDGIGKSVQYGLYCITNFIWIISLYLSNATGYLVQEAYKLDFINDMADSIGKGIQTIAGITSNGFSNLGFYVGFLLLIILIIGIYVAYTGLIKRETSKSIHAVINFVVVFLVSASFIAYAPDYIKKINDFSSDISTASLDLGTKIMLPDSESKGKDSVDLIRDSLFAIQVQKPWLLLQFDNSDIEEIGSDRVEALVSASPSDEDGKTREDVVKTEIEDRDNVNLSIPQVVNRLGMVFFLFIFNLGITIFIFLLTAMMIFSQILFIIFAMFLPVSFLLSMIPGYEGMAKKAIVKVFNTIMTRAGITLIVTVAFSISSMFYNMSTDYPFFMVAFLQIVTFAGIYFELGDLMSMFSLNANDSQTMGRRIFRRPYMSVRHRATRMVRQLTRSVGAGSVASAAKSPRIFGNSSSPHKPNKEKRNNTVFSSSFGSRAGVKVGGIMDTKKRIKDKASAIKETVKDMPTQAGYAVHSAKVKANKNVSDFKSGVVQEQVTRQSCRADKLNQHRLNLAKKRMEMQNAQEAKSSEKKIDELSIKEKETEASRPHERPATAPKPERRNVQKPENKKHSTIASSTEPGVKGTHVKSRSATAIYTRKGSEQRQSIQSQTVKAKIARTQKARHPKKKEDNLVTKEKDVDATRPYERPAAAAKTKAKTAQSKEVKKRPAVVTSTQPTIKKTSVNQHSTTAVSTGRFQEKRQSVQSQRVKAKDAKTTRTQEARQSMQEHTSSSQQTRQIQQAQKIQQMSQKNPTTQKRGRRR